MGSGLKMGYGRRHRRSWMTKPSSISTFSHPNTSPACPVQPPFYGPAETLRAYLAPADAPRRADLIIGFGHFDRRIPAYCARLYGEGYAPKILFTGGRGSGSGALTAPEALVFRDEARRLGVPGAALFIESGSTNTPENVRFSLALLAALDPPFTFGSALLVAHPYRQRRVWLTCRKLLPDVALLNAPVPSTLEADVALFHRAGTAYAPLLLGEVGRIRTYAARGDIAAMPLPDEVLRIYRTFSPS